VTAYGIPYTVRGWGGEVVTTCMVCEPIPDSYTAVLRAGESPVILVPTAALTPVDTTPAEPEPGAWLIGEKLCVRPEVANVLCRWLNLDDCEWYLWEDLWRNVGGPDVPIVRLVPEPPAVELPWEWTDLTTGAGRVVVGHIRPTRVKDGNTWISVECAEAKGWALLTAARAAREVDR
jgi:hypothetical protein